jgi:hypothetical protein
MGFTVVIKIYKYFNKNVLKNNNYILQKINLKGLKQKSKLHVVNKSTNLFLFILT